MKTSTISPVEAARLLHRQIGWSTPSDFSLEDVANALGILIKEVPIGGSEGRILVQGDSAVMSIDSGVTSYQPKRNFVIAHEIGHFILHKNIAPLFSDTDKTLSEWYQKGPQEQEANQFATEFLMPEQLFKLKLAKRKLNINLIREVSSYFKTSLTATFLRYVACGDYPLMIVFIENGFIKWKRLSNDFPFKFLEYDTRVPELTVAGDYFYNDQHETEPDRVDAIQWFPDNFQLQRDPEYKLWEQCYPVSESGFISCLWTD